MLLINVTQRANAMSLSTLCLECGLCCDGTLFRHVVISQAEREALTALGIGTGVKRREPVMWLPCGKLEGKCCTVYEQRPQGCRKFVCAVGQRLVRKEVSLDEARALISQMHARLEALRVAFSVPAGESPLRFARAAIDSTTTSVTEEQLAAFRRVEDLRYEVFMPPPA